MKNILLISHHSDLSGGPISLSLLAKGLNKNKYKVFYLVPSFGPILCKFKESGIEIIILDNKELPQNKFFRKIKKLTYFAKVFKIIKEKKIDLIHANTIFADFGAQAGEKAGIPVIWHIRENILDSKYNSVSKKKIDQLSCKVIVVSQWLKNAFTQLISKEKMVVIHNGIDLSQFNSNLESKIKEEFEISQDVKLVGIIGSLEENKGVDFFIQAAVKIKSKISNVKFLIVGNTPFNQEAYLILLKNLVKKMGIEEDVIFCGARIDVPQIIKVLDVIVVSSKFESFSRVVIEGMAMGKAVVASNCGGIPEIIENKKSGILFPVGDVSCLASSVITLLENKNLAEKLGKEGKIKVKENFSIEKHVQEVEKLYEQILGK